jgi:hypothetical protein
MRPAAAVGSPGDVTAPHEPNEGVELGALFAARRWVVVGQGGRALERGVACVASDPEVLATPIDLRSGHAIPAVRLLSPREPVLVVVDPSTDWVRLAQVLAALKVHHGPMVLLFPETPTPSDDALLAALHERGGRLLQVRVGDGIRPAFVLRHVRVALSGTTLEPDPMRIDQTEPAVAADRLELPVIRARLPLELPLQPRAVERLIRDANDLERPSDRPGPFVALRSAETDPRTLAVRLLELLVHGVVPVVPEQRLEGLPLGAGVAAGLHASLRWPATPWSAERDSVRLRRAVLQEHTEAGERARARSVSVALVTRRPGFLSHALDQVLQQTHRRLELIVVGHGIDPGRSIEPRHRSSPVALRTAELPTDRTLGDGLRLATEMASGELVLKMDDDDWYGSQLVSDLVLALEVSGAELVGSAMDFVYLASLGLTIRRGAASERFGSHVSGATLLLRRDDLATLGGWPRVPRAVDSRLLDAVRVAGGSHYAMHGFGYLVNRHLDGNTFTADDAWFLSGCAVQWPGLDLAAADVDPPAYGP